MTNEDKITVLDIIEKKWIAISLAVVTFVAGFAVGHAVGDHTAKPKEESTITASAEELPQYTFNYALNTVATNGTTYFNTYVPFSYVYRPDWQGSQPYYGAFHFVSNTSVDVNQATNAAIVNYSYTISGLGSNLSYNYSLGNGITSNTSSFTLANGASALGQSFVFFRVFTDYNDFRQIDTTVSPSVQIYFKRATDVTTLFGSLLNDYVNDIVYNVINIRFKSLDGNNMNMGMIFPMIMRSTLTGLNSGAWNYTQGIGDNYNTGYANGIEFADNRLNTDSVSYKQGYNIGKEVGHEETDFSFSNLMLSIFDAPLTVLQKALNFEILGVNMGQFVLALITLAIIVFVVKIFIK